MGKTKEIKDMGTLQDMLKFRNVDVNGKQGSDKTGDFSDADFPISV
jgi:hypothetical protein